MWSAAKPSAAEIDFGAIYAAADVDLELGFYVPLGTK